MTECKPEVQTCLSILVTQGSLPQEGLMHHLDFIVTTEKSGVLPPAVFSLFFEHVMVDRADANESIRAKCSGTS
jgi:hypothetical protein